MWVSARVSTPPVTGRASSARVNVIPSQAGGWHAPAGRRTWEPRPLAQARQIRPAAPVGTKETWARPTGRFPRQPAASADWQVRPGPRPPTLRPNQSKTAEAGPEHLSTSSLPTMNVYYFNRHFGAVLRRLSVLFLRAGFAARDVPRSCSRLGRRSLGSAVSGWAVMAPLRYRFPRPSLAGRSPCTQGSKTCGVVSRYGRLVSALATAGISAMISACHPVPVLPLSARRLCAPSATQTMISGR